MVTVNSHFQLRTAQPHTTAVSRRGTLDTLQVLVQGAASLPPPAQTSLGTQFPSLLARSLFGCRSWQAWVPVAWIRYGYDIIFDTQPIIPSLAANVISLILCTTKHSSSILQDLSSSFPRSLSCLHPLSPTCILLHLPYKERSSTLENTPQLSTTYITTSTSTITLVNSSIQAFAHHNRTIIYPQSPSPLRAAEVFSTYKTSEIPSIVSSSVPTPNFPKILQKKSKKPKKRVMGYEIPILVGYNTLLLVLAAAWIGGYLDPYQRTLQDLVLGKMGDNRASFGVKCTYTYYVAALHVLHTCSHVSCYRCTTSSSYFKQRLLVPQRWRWKPGYTSNPPLHVLY